jgi:acyl carrier protein
MLNKVLPGQEEPVAVALELEREVAGLIISALNFPIDPGEIDPEAPLYGSGLGLDSIDILEVALVISKRYGFHLRADNENNVRIFGSLRSLAGHIAAQRTT